MSKAWTILTARNALRAMAFAFPVYSVILRVSREIDVDPKATTNTMAGITAANKMPVSLAFKMKPTVNAATKYDLAGYE